MAGLTIDLRAADFSLDNALALATIAGGAYHNSTWSFRHLFDNWRDVDLISDGVSGTQCFVATTTDTVVVAFRGTSVEIQDFVADLKITQEPGCGGQVHSGDKQALDAIWAEVVDLVRARRQGNRGLVVTGHSLGGALATLAAWQFRAAGLPPAQVYTFGAPRVGDRTFARDYPVTLYRVVNRRDLVPHLPPDREDLQRLWSMVLDMARGLGPVDYTHVGHLVHIGLDGRLRIDADDAAIFLASAVSEWQTMTTRRLEEAEDHSPDAYVANLRALAGAGRSVA